MMQRRQALLALAGGALGFAIAPPAQASTARAISLKELARYSHTIFVGTPFEADSRWEDVAGGRRIVTYSRVRVEESIADMESSRSEVVVRTLGGQVGEVGQIVHGEALLVARQPNVLCLFQASDGAEQVTGMAQGAYIVRRRVLAPNPGLSKLVGVNNSSAVRMLSGKGTTEAARLLRGARP